MIVALDFGTPRFSVCTHPCFAFRFPLSAQIMRDCVGQPERNEIHCAFLLPMWQAIRSEPNVCVRIEEVQFGQRKAKSIKARADSENAKNLQLALQAGADSNPPFFPTAD